jgi:hypothetical protein
LHGIGQHQHREAAAKRVVQHFDNLGVHERLAAGEADLSDRKAIAHDFVEEGSGLGTGDVGQPIVLGARLDVAVTALDIAKAAGVDPQRAQRLKPNASAALAFSGPIWIGEFCGGRG